MDSRTTRRRLVATLLAIAFAAETVGVVAASFPGQPAVGPVTAQAPTGTVLAADATPESLPTAIGAIDEPVVTRVPWATPEPSASPAATPAPSAVPEPKATAKPKPKATAKPKAAPKPRVTPKPKATPKPTARPKPAASHKLTAADFSGTNHVWIPALGISKSVKAFPCERSRPPDQYMYRWGCAGDNNVYLLGHAYTSMEPLHDAYYSGRLKVGMKAYYAGANGKVHVYAVRWWKTTLPTPDAEWAWAPQAVPSMTLQTCVGKNSKYRLMVRLVEVGG